MRSGPNKAVLHYYGSLTDFFADSGDEYVKEVRFKLHPGARDLIESQGVPHVEIYALRVNGVFNSLDYQVRDGDELEIYPKSYLSDFTDEVCLKRTGKPSQRFIADVQLGKLARLLRLLGIDTLYSNHIKRSEILDLVVSQERSVLSRSLDLLKHGKLEFGYWPRSDDPDQQVVEVVDYFELLPEFSPFSRCLECNGLLAEVELQEISGQVPEKVRQWCDDYVQCGQCGKAYWQGSHYEKLKKKIDQIRAQV
ncbi:Mut7-C ubiquitin/RNAse domain-containing protein [Aliifodinibius sp. S!AR15-10]|uniref:Mut7-C RNAse domain-containing protein n=1 Tax=Aliifodinibius sp. S!AR15-10 TaxID=2950437 RepID=UPI002863BF45|nr:Mut7-C RNAse domain-containing protein [Aliifodinibius sp. S!AR15-10]MDR8394210.1 Mut7-C ubiquitin/RNAse domain-containing protein [Aliifodinibius sp. S!AR15-10]